LIRIFRCVSRGDRVFQTRAPSPERVFFTLSKFFFDAFRRRRRSRKSCRVFARERRAKEIAAWEEGEKWAVRDRCLAPSRKAIFSRAARLILCAVAD
jgi:hypothetical protein